jgi:hypothetical protein
LVKPIIRKHSNGYKVYGFRLNFWTVPIFSAFTKKLFGKLNISLISTGFAFENIFKPSKVMPATFLSSPKPTMKAEQSRKHRVVLGELTDFILSPLRKQRADESPSPAKTIGENNGNGGGMGRSSRQNGITVWRGSTAEEPDVILIFDCHSI